MPGTRACIYSAVWKGRPMQARVLLSPARATSLSLLEARDPVVKGLGLLSLASQPASAGGWLPKARCFGGTYMIP